jgi:hypothetical protein
LDALFHMLRKPARAFLKYPAEVRSRALDLCQQVAILESVPSADMIQAVQGLDSGEALLYGVAAENPCVYLASNDKRAMEQVATVEIYSTVRSGVAGRVVCMEQVVRRLIEDRGAGFVAKRFEALGESDKRIGSILSPARSGRPQDCLLAANSYLSGLKVKLGEDFLFHDTEG